MSVSVRALVLSAAIAAPSTALAGRVYTSTNAVAGNAITVYDRDVDGLLTLLDEIETGGLGTGAGLGDQGAVVISPDHAFLLAVNAGSDDLSTFSIENGTLELVDVQPSGGDLPISVTVAGDVVYVLNAGPGTENVSGFYLSDRGYLEPIPGAILPLSGVNVGPAQLELNAAGTLLAVTEKGTSLIDVYTLDADGLASQPYVQGSEGTTPFGFRFFTYQGEDRLVVSEAFEGAVDASAASSYAVDAYGTLTPVSSSVPTLQTAACWVALTGNGRFGYTANTGSGSVTGYTVAPDGTLAFIGNTPLSGAAASSIDLAFSRQGRFLYVLDQENDQIDGFRVESDGSLTGLGAVPGAAGIGLAAF